MRFKTIKRIINIRISEVKMQRSDNSQNAKTTHRRVQSSTTLNRKYVQKPTSSTDVTVSVKKSAKLRHFADQPMKNSRAEAQDIKAAEMHPLQATAIAKMQEQKTKPLKRLWRQRNKRLKPTTIKVRIPRKKYEEKCILGLAESFWRFRVQRQQFLQ